MLPALEGCVARQPAAVAELAQDAFTVFNDRLGLTAIMSLVEMQHPSGEISRNVVDIPTEICAATALALHGFSEGGSGVVMASDAGTVGAAASMAFFFLASTRVKVSSAKPQPK